MPAKTRKKVAIVGSGCAGLGAAWALKDTDYEVHIFEKQARLGGHTNTQTWTHAGKAIQVDTGFIVMNTATYPNFINFLKDVGIEPTPTEMSFGVCRDHDKFEWSGSLQGVFAQRRNLFRISHWRMLFDIVRFNQYALDLLTVDEASTRDITIGQYLDEHHYSQAFRDEYLIPMTAAVWSTSPDKASLEFPAQTLIRFMWNHHLLSSVSRRPDWLTIPGGAQRYIDAIVTCYPEDRLHQHFSAKVIGLNRPPLGVKSRIGLFWERSKSSVDEMGNVQSDYFDHVILACHGDEVLPILTGADILQRKDSKPASLVNGVKSSLTSEEEYDVLNSFKTTENICYLHSDLSLMPTRRATWSSWNYLIQSQPSKRSHPAGVSLTYNMNILQHIPEGIYGPVLVTMNPGHKPDPRLTQGQYNYRHPLYTVEAVRAQERLESIQNQRGVSYCGAWTKYGFHEDGFSSGLRVAIEHLGGSVPYKFVDSTYSRGSKPEFGWPDYALRVFLLIIMIMLRMLDRITQLPVLCILASVLGMLGSTVLDLIEEAGLLS